MARSVIAFYVLLIWGAIEAAVAYRGFPSGLSDMAAGRLLGMLEAAALMVLGYYFTASPPHTPDPPAPPPLQEH